MNFAPAEEWWQTGDHLWMSIPFVLLGGGLLIAAAVAGLLLVEYSTTRQSRRVLRFLIILLSGTAFLTCGIVMSVTASDSQNALRNETLIQQAEEVYGLTLDYEDAELLVNTQDDDIYYDVLVDGLEETPLFQAGVATAETVDGDEVDVQLVWDGEEWILADSLPVEYAGSEG